MAPIRFWQTRHYLLVLIPVILMIDLFVYYCVEYELVALVGLGLDIFGAIILAIPDIPELDDYTVHGLLRHNQQSLSDQYLSSPRIDTDFFEFGSDQGKGFNELKAALRKHVENGNQEDYDWENIVLFQISADPDTFAGEPYLEGQTKSVDGGIKELTLHLGFAQEYLRREIEAQEGRVRRFGITLLLIGFLHLAVPYFI